MRELNSGLRHSCYQQKCSFFWDESGYVSWHACKARTQRYTCRLRTNPFYQKLTYSHIRASLIRHIYAKTTERAYIYIYIYIYIYTSSSISAIVFSGWCRRNSMMSHSSCGCIDNWYASIYGVLMTAVSTFPNILNLCMYREIVFFALTVNKSSLLEHQDPLFLSTRLLSIANPGCVLAAF